MSENNVVDIAPVKQGDSVFMLCACDPADPAPYLAQVIVQDPPIIQGLLCPKCTTYCPVVNGFVHKPERV